MVVFSSVRAFMDPAFLSILSKVAPPDKLGLVLGLTGTAVSVLSTPGPMLGGVLWNMVAPAVPFWTTGVILLLVAVPVWLKFRVPKTATSKGE
jgi:predicted MFS family arabinose efflux permease